MLYIRHKNVIWVIKSRRMRWERHVARTGGGERGAYRVLVGISEENRPLGTHRRKFVNNIKMDLRVRIWCVGRIYLAQERATLRAVVNTVMNLRVLYNAGNFLTG
jgi:hypothetical protein